jgi:tryptophanyl-tRNA synthetase
VYVLDEPDRIRKKFRSAVTDSGAEIRRDREKPGGSALIEVLAAVRGVSREDAAQAFAGATGYGPFKDAVADAVIEYLAPVRERYEQLRADETALEATLEQGAEKARAIARPTLNEVRDAMGVGPVRPRT